jgi:excisionase family DNA binding protein
MMKRRIRNPVLYVSVAEASALYGFHPNTIRAWAHRDGLPFLKRGRGGKMYFRAEDIRRFLDTHYTP